jgi:hypothetical protein
MPTNYPAWKDQTVEQKFDFLHEWLMNVEITVRDLRADTRGLGERLRAVEVANAQRPPE